MPTKTDQQMQTLSKVSVGLMFEVIEPLGEIVTTLPVGSADPGRTAGPSFELFYQPDYLLPHLRAAWLLMAEHLDEAADLALQGCVNGAEAGAGRRGNAPPRQHATQRQPTHLTARSPKAVAGSV